MDEKLVERLKKCRDLPSLPKVAMDIVDLCKRDDFDADRLCNLLQRDPAIAAKVLRMANSSMFALGRPVNTIRHAVAMLGANTVVTIALSFSLVTRKGEKKGGFNYDRFWRRALLS